MTPKIPKPRPRRGHPLGPDRLLGEDAPGPRGVHDVEREDQVAHRARVLARAVRAHRDDAGDARRLQHDVVRELEARGGERRVHLPLLVAPHSAHTAGARRVRAIHLDPVEPLAEDQRVARRDPACPGEPRAHHPDAPPVARGLAHDVGEIVEGERHAHHLRGATRRPSPVAPRDPIHPEDALALGGVERGPQRRAIPIREQGGEPEMERAPEDGVGGLERVGAPVVGREVRGVLVVVDVREVRGEPGRREHGERQKDPRDPPMAGAPRDEGQVRPEEAPGEHEQGHQRGRAPAQYTTDPTTKRAPRLAPEPRHEEVGTHTWESTVTSAVQSKALEIACTRRFAAFLCSMYWRRNRLMR